jgi:hypothetical protein
VDLVRLYTSILLACLDAIQKEVQNALRKNFVPNNPLVEGWYSQLTNAIYISIYYIAQNLENPFLGSGMFTSTFIISTCIIQYSYL